jgi:polyphosphate glucokinase
MTAPHFDGRAWAGYDLAHALAKALDRPVRLLNDAEVQGLAIIKERGLEVVLTLGTGVGTAVFVNGALAPHLELAHHPIRGRMTYNDYVGDATRQSISKRKWNKRVWRMIGIVETLLCYDRLYIGGGNAVHIMFKLPHNVSIVANENGIIGGVRVWDDTVWSAVKRLYAR